MEPEQKKETIMKDSTNQNFEVFLFVFSIALFFVLFLYMIFS